MSTNEVLFGIGLILVLAVGSQILAGQLHLPALVLLLPVGFVAGALTDDIDPNRLFGAAFSPMVSLAVAVILYEAGLQLDLHRLRGHTRRVVIRLIAFGVPITLMLATVAAAGLLGLSHPAAAVLGAILVVSGPTVVGPLLAFVRPTPGVRRVLAWEGSLIDPVGAILAAVLFHSAVASTQTRFVGKLAQFLGATAIGLAGGVVGVGLLWFALRRLRLPEPLATSAQLAAVVAVAAGCDIVRDDSGLIAAIVMGLVVANAPGFDAPARRPFLETLVQLIIGVLFISIAATVTPESLRHLVAPTMALVAVLVLLARPLVAAVATRRSDLIRGERALVGWMAPRGIVAAATAATFGTGLANAGIGGAEKILPATFVVIVATVTLYGLTAEPVARRLGVTGRSRARPLLVGGEPWVLDLARALRSAGVEVLMWAGVQRQREQIRAAGLELVPGELLAAATGRAAALEGITAVLLLTAEDDFNALAATVLPDSVDGPVLRLGPPADAEGVVAPYTEGGRLFGAELTRSAISRRYAEGARIVARAGDGSPDRDPLFVVRADGRLTPVTIDETPEPEPGDTLVLLEAADTR